MTAKYVDMRDPPNLFTINSGTVRTCSKGIVHVFLVNGVDRHGEKIEPVRLIT